MTAKQLSREPQNVDKATWYYEENTHISIVHYSEFGAITFSIPIRMIRESLKRYNKIPKRKKR